jgi:pyruvate dehydrogenase E2 component (dihydrolipoamide acetyltransferase)
MIEGTVVKWRKKEGEKIKAGEIVAEIETDKAVMESEAFEAGTMAAVLVAEGLKVPVGTVLAVLATGKEDPAEIKKKYAGGAKPAPAVQAAAQPSAPPAQRPAMAAASSGGGRAASHGGSTITLEGAVMGEVHEPDEMGHGATREPATAVPAVKASGNGDRTFASPLARRIAADKGVDVAQINGTGPGGRVVQRDVLEYAAKPKAPAAAVATAPATPAIQRVDRGQSQTIPLNKMRSAIGAALQRSKQQIPHFYTTVEVDVEELMAIRVRVNKLLESQGVKLSLNDFVSKAVSSALLMHPAVNAHFTGDAIIRFGDVHLGVAVAIPDGLIVPVIRNADQLGLKELQKRTAELAKKAKSTPPRLTESEMKGATFTISNLGMFGVKEFSAIINPPSVAILAVAGAEKRAVVRNDQIVARTTMNLTLSADHRAVDGATAAEFLRTLKGLLEEPGMMLV